MFVDWNRTISLGGASSDLQPVEKALPPTSPAPAVCPLDAFFPRVKPVKVVAVPAASEYTPFDCSNSILTGPFRSCPCTKHRHTRLVRRSRRDARGQSCGHQSCRHLQTCVFREVGILQGRHGVACIHSEHPTAPSPLSCYHQDFE